MAHYAFLNEHSVVTTVIVGNDEGYDGVNWEDYYAQEMGQPCKRTSYNTCGNVHYGPDGQPDGLPPFRGNYAAQGFFYDATLDVFIPPKPFPSWLLNTQHYLWDPPVPCPQDGKYYVWDEATQSWMVLG
jgi:hypothetical protein